MKEFITKLKRVKTLDDLLKLLKNDGKKLKKLALPVIVFCVIIGLYTGGGEQEVTNEIQDQQILAPTVLSTSIYIDIDGEVRCPGVYELTEGSRLFNVIEMAGGLTQDANTTSINQASVVSDGQKIYIPSINDIEAVQTDSSGTLSGSLSGNSYPNSQGQEKDQNGKININYADEITLQEIPGIGPAKSEKIIQYREENGPFESVDDLVKVSGIGEKTLENMRPYITV